MVSAIHLMCESSICSFPARWAQSLARTPLRQLFRSSVPSLGSCNGWESLLYVGGKSVPHVACPLGHVTHVYFLFQKTALQLLGDSRAPCPPLLPPSSSHSQGDVALTLHHPLSSVQGIHSPSESMWFSHYCHPHFLRCTFLLRQPKLALQLLLTDLSLLQSECKYQLSYDKRKGGQA